MPLLNYEIAEMGTGMEQFLRGEKGVRSLFWVSVPNVVTHTSRIHPPNSAHNGILPHPPPRINGS